MFTFIRNLVEVNKKTIGNSKGAAMIEYALIVAAIVAVAGWWFVADDTGASAQGISGAINTKMQSVSDSINE